MTSAINKLVNVDSDNTTVDYNAAIKAARDYHILVVSRDVYFSNDALMALRKHRDLKVCHRELSTHCKQRELFAQRHENVAIVYPFAVSDVLL